MIIKILFFIINERSYELLLLLLVVAAFEGVHSAKSGGVEAAVTSEA